MGRFSIRERFEIIDPESKPRLLGWYVWLKGHGTPLKYGMPRTALALLGLDYKSRAARDAVRVAARERVLADLEALERGETPEALKGWVLLE